MSDLSVNDTTRQRLDQCERELADLRDKLSAAQGQVAKMEDEAPQVMAPLAAIRQKLGAALESGAEHAEVALLAERERDAASKVDAMRALHEQRITAMNKLRSQIANRVARREELLADMARLDRARQTLEADITKLQKRAADAAHELAALQKKILGEQQELNAVRHALGLPPTASQDDA